MMRFRSGWPAVAVFIAGAAPVHAQTASAPAALARQLAARQHAMTHCRVRRERLIRQWRSRVAPLARKRGLSPRATRAFQLALARKLRSRLSCRGLEQNLAAVYRRHLSAAQIKTLLRQTAEARTGASSGTPPEALARFSQLRQLNRQATLAWLHASVNHAAMMRVLADAAANFALLEKEPAGGEPGRLAAPQSVRLNIYPPARRAGADLARALRRAPRENKRILLDFGGNWCYDCHVLDQAFRHSRLTPLLRRHFLVVHINIGTFNVNRALARRYGVGLKKGVPALAVLSCRGRLLYGQKLGQFEDARALSPAAVEHFLRQWSSPDCAR